MMIHNEGLIMIEDKIHEIFDTFLTDFRLPASNRSNLDNYKNPLHEALREP